MSEVKIVLFSLTMLFTSILYSQDLECREIKGEFLNLPKLNSGCGVIMTAEKIFVITGINDLDTLEAYIPCSEIYKGKYVELSKEYTFKIYMNQPTEWFVKYYGITKKEETIHIINEIWWD